MTNTNGRVANSLEKALVAMGLAITQMLDLLGLKQTQRSIFNAKQEQLEVSWLSSTVTLLSLYVGWKQSIFDRLDDSADYTSHDLSKILDIDRFNLLQMMRRGYIKSDQFFGRQHIFKAATIRGLVEYNSVHMTSGGGLNTRGPLAEAFVRWLKPQLSEVVRIPDRDEESVPVAV